MLLFSQIEEESPPGQRFWLAIFCGMAFASAAGLSVYVTLTFALFVIYWTLDTLARKHFRAFLAYLAAGVVTLLLSWPYLLDLYPRNFSAASSAESAPRIAYFGLREGPAIVDPLRHLHLHNPVLMELAKLPALLITYMLEFGFFAVIMFLAMRRDMAGSKPLSRQRRMVWTMFAVCLLAMTVLRSDTTGFNDLGFRWLLPCSTIIFASKLSPPPAHECHGLASLCSSPSSWALAEPHTNSSPFVSMHHSRRQEGSLAMKHS
jgi:hypothetical protein